MLVVVRGISNWYGLMAMLFASLQAFGASPFVLQRDNDNDGDDESDMVDHENAEENKADAIATEDFSRNERVELGCTSVHSNARLLLPSPPVDRSNSRVSSAISMADRDDRDKRDPVPQPSLQLWVGQLAVEAGEGGK